MEKHYDLAVIGGGFSGCAAALAAARGGAKVLLVERINALGGAPCTMAVNPFMRNATTLPDTNERKQLSQGIFAEIYDALKAEGATRDNIFNPEYLKIILNRKMKEAGVDLLFNSLFVSAKREGNRVVSVTVANKSGLTELEADFFVDATGDADVAYSAGFPTRLGRPEDNLCQPMTLCFSIGGASPPVRTEVRRKSGQNRSSLAGGKEKRDDQKSDGRHNGVSQHLPGHREPECDAYREA